MLTDIIKDSKVLYPVLSEFINNWYDTWHESKLTTQKLVFKSNNQDSTLLDVSEAQPMVITAILNDLIHDPDSLEEIAQFINDHFDTVLTGNHNFFSQLEIAINDLPSAQLNFTKKSKIMASVLNQYLENL